MLLKVLAAAAVVTVSLAAVWVKQSKKTADRISEEESILAPEDRMDEAEFASEVASETINSIKESKVVVLATLVFNDVQGYMARIHEYRVTIALIVLGIGSFGFSFVPLGAKAIAYSIIGQEIACKVLGHVYEVAVS